VLIGPWFNSFLWNGPSVPAHILRRLGGAGRGVRRLRGRLQLVEGAIEVVHVEDEAGADADWRDAWADQAVEGSALQADVRHGFGQG